MNNVKRFFQYGQQGFTLIELLIVIAVLGALAAVVSPNITKMLGTSSMAAANMEVANLRTTLTSYLADKGYYPADSDALVSGGYTSGTVKGIYTFDAASGNISSASNGAWPADLIWQSANQTWRR